MFRAQYTENNFFPIPRVFHRCYLTRRIINSAGVSDGKKKDDVLHSNSEPATSETYETKIYPLPSSSGGLVSGGKKRRSSSRVYFFARCRPRFFPTGRPGWPTEFRSVCKHGRGQHPGRPRSEIVRDDCRPEGGERRDKTSRSVPGNAGDNTPAVFRTCRAQVDIDCTHTPTHRTFRIAPSCRVTGNTPKTDFLSPHTTAAPVVPYRDAVAYFQIFFFFLGEGSVVCT